MDRGPRDHFSGSHYDAHHVTGPLSFLNPTKRYIPVAAASKAPERPSGGVEADAGRSTEKLDASGANAPEGIYHVWKSRDNRKGRHSAIMTVDAVEKGGTSGPKRTDTCGQTWGGISKMFVRFPVWDISYDVATMFTLGSIIWVINAFFVWLPVAAPDTEFPGESTMGGGVTAFIGATVFEIGSVLLMLEAVNENRSDCFGWALEAAVESSTLLLYPRHEDCHHHHKDRNSLIAGLQRDSSTKSLPQDAQTDPGQSTGARESESRTSKSARRWLWWPSWYELSTHYFRDIGFLACLSQMFGATVFWISGFTGLPPILDSLSTPAENGAFWLPQVVGGTGFIVSSLLFMLEVQEKWYLPAFNVLGWHIGFWNLVGALGFTLCGAFGFAIDEDGMEFASTLCTFIGSWAFLVGSVIQWYESLDKYPITVGDAPPHLPDGGSDP